MSDEVKQQFGTRLETVRTAIRTELEAAYPDFKNRLTGVLEQHGPATRWTRFLSRYDPALLGRATEEIGREIPDARGWYPGKVRDLARRFLDNQGELVEALKAEFPGAAEKIVTVIEETDPDLQQQLLSILKG